MMTTCLVPINCENVLQFFVSFHIIFKAGRNEKDLNSNGLGKTLTKQFQVCQILF